MNQKDRIKVIRQNFLTFVGVLVAFVFLPLSSCENALVEAAKSMQALETTPVMEIKDGVGIVLASGNTVDLGNLGIDASVDYSFEIFNKGKTALVFDASGTTVAMTDGTEVGTFSLITQPSGIGICQDSCRTVYAVL